MARWGDMVFQVPINKDWFVVSHEVTGPLQDGLYLKYLPLHENGLHEAGRLKK